MVNDTITDPSKLVPFYKQKPEAYFSGVRYDLISMIGGSQLSILEIGCGNGATGAELLRTGKARWVSGVEVVSTQAELAKCVLNEVLVGDISQLQLPWQIKSFDCIVAGDILEHLVDPWNVLRKLEPLLTDSGTIVASLPNVRHWFVVKDLVWYGEWRYQPYGVLDETHLRFFTRRSALRLFQDCGYEIVTARPYRWGSKTRVLNRVTLGLFVEFLAHRWLFTARKAYIFKEK